MHRRLAQSRRLPQFRLQAHNTGIGLFEAEIGADGLATQPNAPLAGVLLFQRHFGVKQGKRQLFCAVFDVDPGVFGFKIRQREKPARPGSTLRGLGPRCSRAQKRIEVPLARGRAHHVQAGLIRADRADFQASPPQREQANGGRNRVGVEDRLRAEGGIILNGKIVQDKARPGQQAHLDGRHARRAAQRS